MTPEQERIAELEAEVESLKKALANPSKLILDYEEGKSALCTIKHWAASLLASSLMESFKSEGGTNFVILEFHTKDGERLFVTIKKADGKTPEEMYAVARAERDSYRDELLRIQAVVGEEDYCLINDCLGIPNIEDDDAR